MPHFEHCPNCGAHLTAGPDGRTVDCAYCGATDTRKVDPGRLAAALRADAGSATALFERVAERLERELPEMVSVERKGGLFTASRIDRLELTLGGHIFRLRRDGNRVVAERSEVVRGIVLKSESVAIDAWLTALSEALSAHAGTSAQALDALRRISG
jgi:uncharacterized Zn finger protein (UPF0148 family)